MSELRSAIDGLLTVDLAGMPETAIGEEICELLAARNRLDGVIERHLRAFDARDGAAADGVGSTAAWLRGRARLSSRDASARVKTARKLRDLPTTRAALEDGEISLDHAGAIAQLAADTDLPDSAEAEGVIVGVARLTDPVRFSAEVKHIRDNAKPEQRRRDDADMYARRRFSAAPSFEGMFSLHGWLHPEGGALVKAALDSLTQPIPDDTRTYSQRCADALVELARRQLDGGALPTNHGARPHLHAIVHAQPAPAQPAHPTGTGTASTPAFRFSRGQLPGGGVLGPEALERIACDATITRVLLGPDGQPLNLGRSTRVVTPAQFKALVIRDGGCVIPGHTCPPEFTEAHHLWSWLSGGPTDLCNLALTCDYGHHLIHEGGFHLYLDDDNHWMLRRPDGSAIRGRKLGETANGPPGSIPSALINGPRGP